MYDFQNKTKGAVSPTSLGLSILAYKSNITLQTCWPTPCGIYPVSSAPTPYPRQPRGACSRWCTRDPPPRPTSGLPTRLRWSSMNLGSSFRNHQFRQNDLARPKPNYPVCFYMATFGGDPPAPPQDPIYSRRGPAPRRRVAYRGRVRARWWW